MLSNLGSIADRVALTAGTSVDPDAQLASTSLSVVDKDGDFLTKTQIEEGLASTTIGKALAGAANAGAALDALGATATGKTLLTAANVAAVFTALGITVGANDSGGEGYRALVLPNI